MTYEITFLRSILNTMHEGVLVVDQTTMKVLLYNKKFLEMWDIDQEILATMDSVRMRNSVLDKICEPEIFIKRVEEIIALKLNETLDIIKLKNETYIERRSIIMELEDKQQGRLYFYRDVTQEQQKHNQTEKTLKEQEMMLINGAQLGAIGEMAGNIAHEINNPLAIIKISAKCLKELVSAPAELDHVMIDKMIGAIENTVERIAKTVSGLSNISRNSTDDKMVCNYGDILNDVYGIAWEKYKRSGIKVIESTPKEILETPLFLNRIQISQVLINLLNNSADALEHLPSSEKWIELRIEQTKESIFLYVTDGGKGIPQEIKDKIFVPFFTTKGIGKGTGIGLSISKKLVEENGGTFYYDERSPNTCFVVKLPLPDQTITAQAV